MHAKTNVKIKRFIVRGDDSGALTSAIGKLLALFDVRPAEQTAGDTACIDEHTIAIENSVIQKPGSMAVKSTFYYRTAGGSVDKLTVENSAPLAEGSRMVAARLAQLNVVAIMRRLQHSHNADWGILHGIRPVKLVHRLLDDGLNGQAAIDAMVKTYGLTQQKASMVTAIASRQRPFLLSRDQARRLVSVYIGIPFCPSKCLYCSFTSYLLPPLRQVEAFLAGLTEEMQLIRQLLQQYNLAVQTVYIGGGTPTSLNYSHFKQLLDTVRTMFISTATLEFSVEAGRPDTVDDDKIAAMCQAGVTRVSVNPQSMQQKTLKQIGRNHTTHAIINLFHKLRAAGMPVINMDVIMGLPGESEADAASTMAEICRLQPDNFTLHTLALKRGSRLKTGMDDYVLPDAQTTRNMHQIAVEQAAAMQLAPYYLYRQKYMSGNLENIGYSRPGAECLYNIHMMEERQTVFGLGPAATTKIVAPADWSLGNLFNPKDPQVYLAKIKHQHEARCRLLAAAFS